MIPRIKMVEPMPNYKLKVLFDDGQTVIYDVKEDSNAIFGANKNNKITFKIRDNEYDKDFNSKIKNIQKYPLYYKN